MYQLKKDKGAILIILAFVIMVGLTGVLVAFMTMISHEMRSARLELRNIQAFYIAEAGRAKARWALTAGEQTVPWLESDTGLGDGTFTVNATNDEGDGSVTTITSAGYIPNDTNPIAQRQVIEEDISLTGGASGENLAKDKNITASSQASGKQASKANDGKMNTYWQSANGGSAWIRIDFGGATQLGYAVYYEEGSNIADYTVEYSSDDTGWTVVPGLNKDGSAATFTSTSARYFRLRITSLLPGSTNVAIREQEMYQGGLGHGKFSTSW